MCGVLVRTRLRAAVMCPPATGVEAVMHGAALGNVKCLLFLLPVVLKLPPACGSSIWERDISIRPP